ncbi:MAG: ATP-binding cassette domain-containing protein, partial [Caulobacteraceae bacterium]|nr:ATP-binding cassette domain-containing protein [Caulobacteraceae bacterium]
MNDPGRFPALTLEGVERRYGRGETTVEVLNGASLTLYSGQSVALIAPSGAGKSTLLHLAGLLERPNAGEVRVGGEPTSTMPDVQRTALRRNHIGFVYQFHHLLPEFSALENLVLPQMIAGLARREAASRGRELLRYLGLAARETHR